MKRLAVTVAALVVATGSWLSYDANAGTKWYWEPLYAEQMLEQRYVNASCRGVDQRLLVAGVVYYAHHRCKIVRKNGTRIVRDLWVKGQTEYVLTPVVRPDRAKGAPR